MTTLLEIATLLDALAPQLAASGDAERELYTPLRRVIAAVRHQAPLETSERIRDYLSLHCRGCGVEHDPREWHMGGHWCTECQAAGVTMGEPLWSPEDWPDDAKRAAGRAQLGRAEALLAEGAWQEAQVELESLHAVLHRGRGVRERAAVIDLLVGCFLRRGNPGYALNLLRQLHVLYRSLGDVNRAAATEARAVAIDPEEGVRGARKLSVEVRR
jgi:hypothetical protein